jgi:hypothetical protein
MRMPFACASVSSISCPSCENLRRLANVTPMVGSPESSVVSVLDQGFIHRGTCAYGPEPNRLRGSRIAGREAPRPAARAWPRRCPGARRPASARAPGADSPPATPESEGSARVLPDDGR